MPCAHGARHALDAARTRQAPAATLTRARTAAWQTLPAYRRIIDAALCTSWRIPGRRKGLPSPSRARNGRADAS